MTSARKSGSGAISVGSSLVGVLDGQTGVGALRAMRHRHTKFLTAVLLALIVSGCGDTHTKGGGGPLPVSVALTTAPSASMRTSTTSTIAATVSNDAANKGVTWSCTPGPSCGSFSPAQTASGAATSYTAPAAPPQGNNVTITATAVSDTTKNAKANVVIMAPAISVAISAGPPTSMQINTTTNLAATVSNDAANKGVTWSCAPTASCGSFNPAQTASGAGTTYTAPAAPPQGNNVTITATAVSDVTASGSATIAIAAIGSNAILNGQYAFLVTGIDGTSGNYTVGGSLTFDGNGNITSGEQDLSNTPGGNAVSPVTGTYTVGPNGRGSMTVLVQAQPGPITETFALTITSGSHALLNEDDGTATGSGVLDRQTAGPNFAASQFSGGYSFTLTGQDQTFAPTVSGGVFTADGASNLQLGTLDQNDAGAFTSTAFTATFTPPDAYGRGTISFSTGATFAYYLVRPQVIRLVETDTQFASGGTAYAQGTASSFSNASLSGRFVFNNVGVSSTGAFAAAGEFVTDGNGNITGGIADANNNGTATSGSLAASTYAFNSSPRGTIQIPSGTIFTNGMNLSVYLVDPNINLLDPNNANGGGGALILTNSATILGIGMVVPQVTAPASGLLGNYAANLISDPNLQEADLTGQLVADPSNNLNGSADYANNIGSSTSFSTTNATLTGAITADVANPGHLTGTVLLTGGTLQFVPGGVAQNLSYYQADATRAFVVETDTNVVAGLLMHQ